MKNITMISRYFAPENEIAAVRPTKLIKYLKKSDEYFFTVITTEKSSNLIKDSLLQQDLSFVDRIIYISEKNVISKFLEKIICSVKIKYRNNVSKGAAVASSVKIMNARFPIKGERLLEQSWIFLKFIAEYQKGLNFYRNTKRYLRKNNLKYDAVLSTYGPCASHWIGKYMKKQKPSVSWIADFRDGPVNDYVPWGFRRYSSNYPKRVCRAADFVTAVSQGVLDELGLPESIRKKVIPNGYDKEDMKGFPPKKQNETMIFTYTGTLYKGKSDLTIFFRALGELIERHDIEKSKIKIQYAGSEPSRFLEQVARYHLDDIAVSYGSVERKQALRLQWESDILLLASWNQPGKTGVVTGKLLEYMMMDRPVLSLISGELPNSKIREITETCKLGFCYEQAHGEKDYAELKKYILEQYCSFIRKSETTYFPNTHEIERYDYRKIAKEFKLLF